MERSRKRERWGEESENENSVEWQNTKFIYKNQSISSVSTNNPLEDLMEQNIFAMVTKKEKYVQQKLCKMYEENTTERQDT